MSSGISQSVTFNRPNNTTAYGAGAVVGPLTSGLGGLLEFANVGSGSNSRFFLTSSQFRWDISAVPSGATSFTLQLYNAAPATPLADGATWDLVSADRTLYLGPVNLGTPVDLGSTLYIEANIINKEMRLSGTSIFAYLVTTSGFTPSAQDRIFLNMLGIGLW